MWDFFSGSVFLDYLVTRPLSHIHANWELSEDDSEEKFVEEEDSFAKLFNELIQELESIDPPDHYHDNEDRLAEYVIAKLGWNIRKENGRWVGMEYEFILQQGGFSDLNQAELIMAAAGRIHAAKNWEQYHFDEMEDSHQRILAFVLTTILYHRWSQN